MLNKSGDYVWFFSWVWLRGNDEMTGMPVIYGILSEICDNFRTIFQFEALYKELLTKHGDNKKRKFDKTDIDIIRLMSDGLTIDQIAKNLNIRTSNINRRKTILFAITNIHKGPTLIFYFLSNGLI